MRSGIKARGGRLVTLQMFFGIIPIKLDSMTNVENDQPFWTLYSSLSQIGAQNLWHSRRSGLQILQSFTIAFLGLGQIGYIG